MSVIVSFISLACISLPDLMMHCFVIGTLAFVFFSDSLTVVQYQLTFSLMVGTLAFVFLIDTF